jgi:endonuclease V-like protein UPF0215 family
MIGAIFTGIVVIGIGMGLFNTVKDIADYSEDQQIGKPEPVIVFVERYPNMERVNQCLELFDEPNMVLIERKELVKECVEANLW